MKLALVLGTARKARRSEKVSQYLLHQFEKRDGVEVMYVDVRDHVHATETVPPWGEGGTETVATDWQGIAKVADVFVFVLPEYNRGYPGEWKMLLDSLYDEYKGKHVYVATVSTGMFAGVRVAEHVKPVLVEVGLILHKASLHIGKIKEAFTNDGEFVDEGMRERVKKFIDAVCTLE